MVIMKVHVHILGGGSDFCQVVVLWKYILLDYHTLLWITKLIVSSLDAPFYALSFEIET